MESMDFYEVIRFPKFGGAEDEGSCDGRAGSIMVRKQSKARGFLRRMGYLEAEELYDYYSVEQVGLDCILELLEGQYTPVMEYFVLKDIPVWYAQINGAL
jgi:hypothetical protein